MTLPCFHPRLRLALLLFSALVARGFASPLDEAVRALDEGVPEVAVVKLQAQLNASAPLAPALRREAKTRLAEAFLAAGRVDEALKQSRDPEVQAPLLEARILAAAGDWNAALNLYSLPDLAREPRAIAGKAECLQVLGRPAEAIDALKSIAAGAPPEVSLRLAELLLETGNDKDCQGVLNSLKPPLGDRERKWKDYLEARMLLNAGRNAEAFTRFEALQQAPHNLSNDMMVGAALGMTESRTELIGLTAADDILEQYIWKHEQSPSLDALFRKLDIIYSGESSASLGELQKWAQREPSLRAGYATYYWAKGLLRDEKPDRALEVLRDFPTRFPRHPLLAEALLMRGRLLTDTGKFADAQKAFDEALRTAPSRELQAEIEMASAQAHFKAGEYVLAATIYRSAGDHAPDLAELARYNTALSWLHQRNFTRFGQDYQEFSRLYPESALRPGLILEEGLLRARQGDPKADQALCKFIHDFPGNPRTADAQLALAELHYAGGQLGEAARYLRVVNDSPAPVSTAEGADYLAIFVAEAANPPKDEKIIALCLSYIERHPQAALQQTGHLAEVRMKLGQVYFRIGDFASAQSQFQTLAEENPNSPLVEAALFLAGQASMQRINGMDDAIRLFSDVASRNGPFKLNARLHLAEIQKRLGNESDAVKIYEDILRANPQSEIKWAAIAGEADNLILLAAKTKDPQRNEQALALYERLAAEPGIPATVLHRALYNKGQCLELLGRLDEALAAYYQVVDIGSAHPQEYFWFYKAGFDACRLSEKREQWKSAIAIYRKMAGVEGPRAEEAKRQMERLRLEHFIWDDGK